MSLQGRLHAPGSLNATAKTGPSAVVADVLSDFTESVDEPVRGVPRAPDVRRSRDSGGKGLRSREPGALTQGVAPCARGGLQPR